MNILNKLGLMTVAEHEAETRRLGQKLFDSEQKRIHWQGEADDRAAKFMLAATDLANQADEIANFRVRERAFVKEINALRPDAEAHRRKLANDARLKREKRAAANNLAKRLVAAKPPKS